MTLIAIFIAKFLDPISFILAGIAGYKLSERSRWLILLIGLCTAVIVEIILNSTQITRRFGQGIPIGLIVSSLHACIGRFIAKKRCKVGQNSEE